MSDPLALLGIGAKAWAELAQIEQDGLRRRNIDSSGMPITWGTFRLVMEVLRDRQSAQAGPGVAAEDVQADLDAFKIWRAHGKGGAPPPQAWQLGELRGLAEYWRLHGPINRAHGKSPVGIASSCADDLLAALDRAVALPEEK